MGDGILTKFKIILALIIVLLDSKNEDPFKIESTRVVTILLPLSVYGMERSGSVVECLTQDRGAAGSSLTGITVLCP